MTSNTFCLHTYQKQYLPNKQLMFSSHNIAEESANDMAEGAYVRAAYSCMYSNIWSDTLPKELAHSSRNPTVLLQSK